MARPKIPYDWLHELENKFGSIANVPESNSTLIKIRKILNQDKNSTSLAVSLEEDIQELLNEGFIVSEIADMLIVSVDTVRRSMRIFDMKPKPRFRYKVTNEANGEVIYGSLYKDFGKLINASCASFKLQRNYLLLEGYHLTKCNPVVLWGELKKGQKYYQNGQLLVKK